jgi:Tol biopolymer transport system component
MSLAPGTRIGPYEVVSALGAGGMGEVYRARDARLGRDVAIKILPDLFAADADRVARFQREAQLLASLNHPHIAQIYGVEDAGPQRALILELVDGPTLADRIAQGPIPLDESLPIAHQVAEALEAAHESGIVHRDLKPANVKLTHDGTVKVLDFGLAKGLDRAGSHEPFDGAQGRQDPAYVLSQSPTITSPAMATNAGVILGTAVYMSPEQAKGKVADKRTDIWAFGCVLYEMLTGRRAFDGEDLTDVIAAVVRGEPDWSALPASVPGNVRTLLKGCLQKDRKARLGDMALVRYLLDHTSTEDAGAALAATRGRPWLWIAAASVCAVVAIAAVTFAWTMRNRAAPLAAPLRLTAHVGTNVSLGLQSGVTAVLSPDGDVMAFLGTARPGTPSSIYVRRLDQLHATLLAGTEGAFLPIFSPDGNSVAFFAQGKLKKVAITGGTPVTLCDAPIGRGSTWSEDGWIYFTPEPNQGIQRVLADGGTPEIVVKLESKELSLRFPQILPGSKVLLFTSQQATGNFENADIVAYSLADGVRKVVVHGGFYARYVPSGHLLYANEGSVFAAPFDLDTLQVTGRAVLAVQGVSASINNGAANYAVSDRGTFVYVAGDTQLTRAPIRWIDRTGKTEFLRSTPSDWANPSFAPDGGRLAVDINDGGQTDVWVYEWARDTMSRLTFDSANDARPVWSPGGRYITFTSRRSGVFNLYLQRADGTGDVVRLTEGANPQFPSSWHPSGKYLAYFETVPGNATDLMILPFEGDDAAGWKASKPYAFLSSRFTEASGMFSPDGRWIAYMSNESGRNDLYVRPFPGPGGKWQVSASPADDPTWSRTSREFLFMDSSELRLMTVPYRVEGDSFRADKPVVWAGARLSVRPRAPSRDLDLHPDGKRFAVASSDEQSPPGQDRVIFILNFFDELRRVAPSKK